ncbi:MAG: Daunorubicin/doxorubicin resistance ATP-binding protein DrrA [Myxococcota bacterium]|nr:Daunorubicin/doxorubicin resistance ATP-binding protein DrrA [Myxococcota bacterium]
MSSFSGHDVSSARAAADAGSPVVWARDVVKRFGGVEAVNGVSFEIAAGECVGLLGPNGAGKSTTIRMIQGLSPRDGGELRVFGQDPAREGPRVRRMIGVVPQEDNLDPDLRVRENLWVYGNYFRIPAARLKPRIEELLELMALTARADALVDELSGGMKRRLVIARALLHEPRMLILDEPTTGLDAQSRRMVWDKVTALREAGITVLLTTHYLEEAERLCGVVLMMDHGRILQRGSPAELIAGAPGCRTLEDVFLGLTGRGLRD